jgi:hypothetical protein
MVRSLFATDLGIWPQFKDMHLAGDRILQSREHRARLANYLIMYDQLVVPTGNLQILPVLRLLLGEDAFDELITNDELVLARFDQWLSYVGNGGLIFYKVGPNPDLPRQPNLVHAFHTPLDETIEVMLRLSQPQGGDARNAQLTKLLNSKVLGLPTGSIVEGLKDVVYKDILGSSHLHAFFSIRNGGKSMDNLFGSDPRKIALFNPATPPTSTETPEIRAVLQVGFENYVLRMAAHLGTSSLAGDESSLSVLRAKGQRFGHAVEGADAFVKMQRLARVPDIGAAFAAGELTVAKLLELRRSAEARMLRKWFEAGGQAETSDEILARYNAVLSRVALVDKLPSRMFRFAVTNAAGLANPALGLAASFVDTFLLSRWQAGASPTLFMIKAKNEMTAKAPLRRPRVRARRR